MKINDLDKISHDAFDFLDNVKLCT